MQSWIYWCSLRDNNNIYLDTLFNKFVLLIYFLWSYYSKYYNSLLLIARSMVPWILFMFIMFQLCFNFIISQLSFHASRIWGRIMTRFCSCIPMVSKCGETPYSIVGKHSSIIRFFFFIQSHYSITHTCLSTMYYQCCLNWER